MRERYDAEFSDVAPFNPESAPVNYTIEVDTLLSEIKKLYDWGGDERRKEITKQLMEMIVSYHWPGTGISGMVQRLSWLLVSEWLETGQWKWIECMKGDLEKIKENVGKIAQGSSGGSAKAKETITLDQTDGGGSQHCSWVKSAGSEWQPYGRFSVSQYDRKPLPSNKATRLS